MIRISSHAVMWRCSTFAAAVGPTPPLQHQRRAGLRSYLRSDTARSNAAAFAPKHRLWGDVSALVGPALVADQVVLFGGGESTPEDLRENDRVVVVAVVGGVDERERAFPRPLSECRQTRTVVAQFLDVASPELLEALGIVTEPLPQIRARRQLLRPRVELDSGAGDSARP